MLVNERIEFIVNWIKSYSENVNYNPVSLIIGVSGGVDSAVASTLSAKTKLKTIAVSMPIRQNSEQHYLSLQHLEWLKSKYNNVETKIIELDHVFNSFEKEMRDLLPSIDAQLESYKMEKDAFDKVEISYQKAVQKLDETQNERWELQRKLANDRSLFDRTEALVDDKEIAVNKLLKVIADLQNQEKVHSNSQSELKRDKNEAGKNLSIAKFK